jgi:hypothetical protein
MPRSLICILRYLSTCADCGAELPPAYNCLRVEMPEGRKDYCQKCAPSHAAEAKKIASSSWVETSLRSWAAAA